MLFIKPKRPAPSADEIASIDNVVEMEATVLDKPAPPAKSAGFIFRRKPAVEAVDAKPGRRPFWAGLRGKPAAEPRIPPVPEVQEVKTKLSKPAKTKAAKPAKAPKVSKALTGGVVLSLDVGSGANVYWTVGATSLEPVDAPKTGRALSFSHADTVIAADEPMSTSSAQDLAVGETGEDVVIVNASKAHGLVMATAKERVMGSGLRLAPGTLALAALLREQPAPQAPRVVGFDLRGGDQHILILFLWGPEGIGLEPCQVVVNPGDVGFTVSQYAASRRLNAEDVNALFFDNAELIGVAAKVPAYPNEDVVLGMPASQALGLGAVLSVLFAVGAAGYAFTQYQELTTAQAQVAAAQAKLKRAETDAAGALEERVLSFAKAQSIEVRRGLTRAQQLWVPGTLVSMEANQDGDTFELVMPLVRGAPVGSRPSVAQALTANELSALVDLSTPRDCTRTGLTVNGTLNEVQLTVTCQNSNPAFTRYRLD